LESRLPNPRSQSRVHSPWPLRVYILNNQEETLSQRCNRGETILSIVSEFEYPKILYLCCLTFLRQYTCIVFGKW
jgi:hypothetical protein